MVDKEKLDQMARETVDSLKQGVHSIHGAGTASAQTDSDFGEHRVNKVIYFLLAFLFGAFGVHKFYAGHILSGVIFLALFVVGFFLTFVFGLGLLIIVPLELVALVQGIMGLCKKEGPDGKVEV